MFAVCRCVAVLLVTMSGALAQAPATADHAPVAAVAPREVVEAIYKLAIGNAKTAPGSPFFEPEVRAARFSREFDRLVSKAGRRAARDGDALIDFDPVTASQDPKVRKLVLTTDVLERDHAVVAAHFQNRGQPTIVVYRLVREGEAWKIDDIAGKIGGQAWSVRRIMADESGATGAPDGEGAPGSPPPAATNGGRKTDRGGR